MVALVLDPRFGEGFIYLLILHVTLWCRQFDIEVVGCQQLCPAGPLADGRDNVLYCQGVVRGQVAPQNKLPLVARRQLKADNVCSIGLERLHREVPRRSV